MAQRANYCYGLNRFLQISLVAAAIYSMCQHRNVLYGKVFFMEMLCTWSEESTKMPDANLHTLGNLHNQAN